MFLPYNTYKYVYFFLAPLKEEKGKPHVENINCNSQVKRIQTLEFKSYLLTPETCSGYCAARKSHIFQIEVSYVKILNCYLNN